MTNQVVRWQGIIFGGTGIVGLLGVLAMAAEESGAVTQITQTFSDSAERFGIFAALTLFLVVCSVGGFIYLLMYVLTTMRECIDDNTMSNMRLRQVLRARPCLTDSDIEKLAGEDSGDEALAKRVEQRHNARKAKP